MSGLNSFFRGKKILITGHSGFKGSWLAHILLGMGSNVAGYSLKPDTEPNLFTVLGLSGRMTNHFADIRNYRKVLSAMKKEKPDIVIHMAAQPLVRPSYDDPVYTYETNLMGTVNVLQAMKEVGGVKAVVMITTDKVYENKETRIPYKEGDELGGHDPYSASKACAEIAIRSYIRSFFSAGTKHETLVASARAGNVLGGGDWSQDRIVPDVVRAIFERNGQVVLRRPEAIRPWQHVLDPLHGYLMLAKGLYERDETLVGAWNFAPKEGSGMSVEELTKKALARIGKGSYVVEREGEKHEMGILMLDAGKARNALGWSPRLGIDQALDWTFEWYKAYYEKEDMVKITDGQIEKFFKG